MGDGFNLFSILCKVGPCKCLSAGLVQDVFFSTQLADNASGMWLGGPQVLLQGTLKGNVTNIIVTMNACVCCSTPPALEDSNSSSPCQKAVFGMLEPNQFKAQGQGSLLCYFT